MISVTNFIFLLSHFIWISQNVVNVVVNWLTQLQWKCPLNWVNMVLGMEDPVYRGWLWNSIKRRTRGQDFSCSSLQELHCDCFLLGGGLVVLWKSLAVSFLQRSFSPWHDFLASGVHPSAFWHRSFGLLIRTCTGHRWGPQAFGWIVQVPRTQTGVLFCSTSNCSKHSLVQ